MDEKQEDFLQVANMITAVLMNLHSSVWARKEKLAFLIFQSSFISYFQEVYLYSLAGSQIGIRRLKMAIYSTPVYI